MQVRVLFPMGLGECSSLLLLGIMGLLVRGLVQMGGNIGRKEGWSLVFLGDLFQLFQMGLEEPLW
ncbi:MAG: hypothetical protein DRP94_09360 [Candidatus Latescibacterota bacterium]|nr:MAG: hypothetical protein DRP94_09360 [Candidatus Latescibacterota bacterium]